MPRKLRVQVPIPLLGLALISVAIAWWADHAHLTRRLEERNVDTLMEALAVAREFKQHAWRVSDHLGHDTAAAEELLEPHLSDLAGPLVASRGWGTVELRRPSRDTIRQVLPLLHHGDADIRQRAAELLALYGEAFHVGPLETRDDFDLLSTEATPRLLDLLDDPSESVRGASILALGELAPREKVARPLIRAFKHDRSNNRLYLAWALQRKF